MQERIQTFFHEAIDTLIQVSENLSDEIEQASLLAVNSLLNDGKILSCGNGESAICADYFTTKLLNHYIQKRPSLPAVSLNNHAITTAIMTDYDSAEIYSKQIRALGSNKDVLLAITSHTNSDNIIEAIHAAHDREMNVIALTGTDCSAIRSSLLATDIEICVPTHKMVRVQEAHLLIINALCNLIDYQLFGSD